MLFPNFSGCLVGKTARQLCSLYSGLWAVVSPVNTPASSSVAVSLGQLADQQPDSLMADRPADTWPAHLCPVKRPCCQWRAVLEDEGPHEEQQQTVGEAEEVGVFTGEIKAHRNCKKNRHTLRVCSLSQTYRTQPIKAANQRWSSAGLAIKVVGSIITLQEVLK